MARKAQPRKKTVLPRGAAKASRSAEAKAKRPPSKAERGGRNSLSRLLLKYSGVFEGLPRDLSVNHDHYLHGTPKMGDGKEKAMTYRGHVRNGAVVLDQSADLPEGAEVEVCLVQADEDEERDNPLRKFLLKYCGVAKGLPADLARNHDHYLHGTPRK